MERTRTDPPVSAARDRPDAGRSHAGRPAARGAAALLLSLAALVAGAVPAFAHGGSYRGGGASGGPGGPPPGPSDEPGPVTAWETWWANNKYLHLQLGEGMREGPEGPITPSARDPAKTDPRDIRDVADDLVRDAVVPIFVEALDDPSFEVRTAAAVALGKTGDRSGAEPLRRAVLKDTHQDVRDSALLGLGLLGRAESVPFLGEVLVDEQATTRHRSFAAFSLGLVGGEDAAERLLGFLLLEGDQLRHRGDPPLFASCLFAMGLTAEESVLPTLRRAARDRQYDEQVRAFAYLALGRAADRESIPLFVEGLTDAQTKLPLQRASAVALGRTARLGDASAVTALFDAVRSHKDEIVRHFAAVSLGGIADAPLCEELRRLFAAAPDRDRAFLALALAIARDEATAPLLRKALATERDDSLRGAYAVALGLLRDTGARELLEAQVRDAGPVGPRGYAALALGMARIGESAEVLRKELADSNDPRFRANLAVGLGLLHDAAATKWMLATLEGDGTLYERGGAAMSLGLLRISAAVPRLVEVYRDRKEMDLLRAYAVVALGILCDPTDPPKLARFTIDNDYSIRNDPMNEVMTIY